MKAEKAKTLWCPCAVGSQGRNRDGDGKAQRACLCLAEACMAWRVLGETKAEGCPGEPVWGCSFTGM